MRWFLSICMVMFFGCSARSQAANPDYAPTWRVGDTWKVKYSSLQSSSPSFDDPNAVGYVDITFVYTVVSRRADDKGKTLVVVKIREDADTKDEWLVTFDEDSMVLTTIEAVFPAGSEKTVNPFGDDAWMVELGGTAWDSTIIFDFPKLPVQNADETRQITAPQGSGAGSFTQTTTFAVNSVTVVLTRTDSTTETEHRTTIVWNKGKKWWSSAETKLGGTVRITGTLLEP